MVATAARLRVVGIDVGGTRKGFHAVALENGGYLEQKKSGDARAMAAWCVDGIGARVIAVDAPCRWSRDGRARPAERALMQKGISCFSSPTRAKALAHRTDYFGWMLRGEELYQALEATHPLVTGLPCAHERFCLETFPHAVTWHLRGGNASARRKRLERSELLRAAGIWLPGPAGIDTVDAALCALTAHLVASGAPCFCFGEASTGYIVVPRDGSGWGSCSSRCTG
jgi:predicted nuclease with RNAse H fold